MGQSEQHRDLRFDGPLYGLAEVTLAEHYGRAGAEAVADMTARNDPSARRKPGGSA
ncbi:MAG: hypothetical protein ACRDJU_05795 [Actinomycetota bacterium]